jgi:hypothetical protein
MITATERPPAPSAQAARRARTFGLGCDARLAGLPLAACPCPGNDEQAYWWRRGWWDVERAWGADALWEHRGLPAVAP